MSGNEMMVKFLCEQGANVGLVDNELHSLIHWITGKFLWKLKKNDKISWDFSLWTSSSV
jgi:hypothetical protein